MMFLLEFLVVPMIVQRLHSPSIGILLPLVWTAASVQAQQEADCAYPLDSPAYASATYAEVVGCLKAGAEPTLDALSVAAARNEDHNVMQALLKAGGDPKGKTRITDMTPLHHAAEKNPNPDVAKVLLEAGADPNAIEEDKWTPLHFAAERNSNPAVTKTLLQRGADHSAKEANGHTPLHVSARFNAVGVIAALVEAGADMGARNDAGLTPLHMAVWNEDHAEAIIRVFLDNGANPNIRDRVGATPLHSAMRADNPTAVKALIEGGADESARTVAGKTPSDINAEVERRRPRVRTVELPVRVP